MKAFRETVPGAVKKTELFISGGRTAIIFLFGFWGSGFTARVAPVSGLPMETSAASAEVLAPVRWLMMVRRKRATGVFSVYIIYNNTHGKWSLTLLVVLTEH